MCYSIAIIICYKITVATFRYIMRYFLNNVYLYIYVCMYIFFSFSPVHYKWGEKKREHDNIYHKNKQKSRMNNEQVISQAVGPAALSNL